MAGYHALLLPPQPIQEIDVDTYEGKMAIKFNEAWGLAWNNVRSAHRHQKVYYDKQSRPPRFNIGERECWCTCLQLRKQKRVNLLDFFTAL